LAAFGQDLKLTPKGETQVPISQWLENRHSACGDLRPQCQKRRRQPREALNAPEPIPLSPPIPRHRPLETMFLLRWKKISSWFRAECGRKFNPLRRHASIGRLPPNNFERRQLPVCGKKWQLHFIVQAECA
jgi:hypothetical protein